MIEVFKTNVSSKNAATKIVSTLEIKFPGSTVNFDLEDCDKILRVEANRILPKKVIGELERAGYKCEVLEY